MRGRHSRLRVQKGQGDTGWHPRVLGSCVVSTNAQGEAAAGQWLGGPGKMLATGEHSLPSRPGSRGLEEPSVGLGGLNRWCMVPLRGVFKSSFRSFSMLKNSSWDWTWTPHCSLNRACFHLAKLKNYWQIFLIYSQPVVIRLDFWDLKVIWAFLSEWILPKGSLTSEMEFLSVVYVSEVLAVNT